MNFKDLAPPSNEGPPRALRVLGLIAMATVLSSTLFTDPKPSLHGDGLLVIAGFICLASGLFMAARREEQFEYARFIGLSLVGIGSIICAAVQPDSAGYAGVYFVVAIGGIRLGRDGAIIVCGGTVGGLVLVQLFEHENPAVVVGTLFSVLPWFLVMRLIRRLGERTRRSEGLVEELRESRAAHAESAALAERGRVARELHDVLAHSLSALALQLEGSRLLARDRGADPEVIEGLERAHHLAVSGLTEARQAISALRGDDLPALEDLAGTFPGAQLTVTGTPREASSEARLALYRTAQEALTNVRRHSASDRVELRLDYEEDGTTLTVQDHGAAAPVIGGRGYGLTGMRERAELLGGRLNAGPTDDGFRVELWLPS
ncbi:histidine kinase [Solirubrobacter ginsenosidimutans]|uniref:histidine kinase n=1 Tax=Solirubrobacter ginsenosidimutans TaxID=490573 RepID=A0A9X3MZA1_9ACTN|nr:histidine kinase [Solirubrobacter ginsenosidimutans]MDA0165594.1 histidine kinase [Solirubrobacter ginsenosidimutans]